MKHVFTLAKIRKIIDLHRILNKLFSLSGI